MSRFHKSRRRPRRSRRGQVFRLFVKRRPKCPLLAAGVTEVDYKNVELLRQYISEDGRIRPARLTNVCAKMQRQLQTAVKRARFLALLPYSERNPAAPRQ